MPSGMRSSSPPKAWVPRGLVPLDLATDRQPRLGAEEVDVVEPSLDAAARAGHRVDVAVGEIVPAGVDADVDGAVGGEDRQAPADLAIEAEQRLLLARLHLDRVAGDLNARLVRRVGRAVEREVALSRRSQSTDSSSAPTDPW